MAIALTQWGMVSTGQENPEIRTASIELQTIMTMAVSRVLKNAASVCPSMITASKKGKQETKNGTKPGVHGKTPDPVGHAVDEEDVNQVKGQAGDSAGKDLCTRIAEHHGPLRHRKRIVRHGCLRSCRIPMSMVLLKDQDQNAWKRCRWRSPGEGLKRGAVDEN